MAAELTTRAYTLKLSAHADEWRQALWQTHLAVNKGTQAWGNWLLTLRGALPTSLANGHPGRRVLLALSWLSVEGPASLVPKEHILSTDQERLDALAGVLNRSGVADVDDWLSACKPALAARIRDDAQWVNRSAAFDDLVAQCPGLSSEWAAATLFDLIGGEEQYFAEPDAKRAAEAKDFVQKAGGWLSRNWGSGEKSDAGGISTKLQQLAETEESLIVDRGGRESLAELLHGLGGVTEDDWTADAIFRALKQQVGWKGRSSKGALALERIRDAEVISADLWRLVASKLREEAAAQGTKGARRPPQPTWMAEWRTRMESLLGMPYRINRDLIWEQAVMLDHALRRVSAAHTWIKRAEVSRREFQEDARKIEQLKISAPLAIKWLDAFRDSRSDLTSAAGDYLIRNRAIDGWEEVVRAWSALDGSTEQARITAVRDVQSNLDDNQKFGDFQLFQALAAEDARCVWGSRDPSILKDYVAATLAEYNQRRFKVPAYRHPDPLLHPVYVDYGNSRWSISYSALEAARGRATLAKRLLSAKSEATRHKLQQKLDAAPDLRAVTLEVWNGDALQSLALRWHGKRLWKDLDLEHSDSSSSVVTRADRFGRAPSGDVAVRVAEVFEQKEWNGRLQVPRDQLDRLADLIYGKNAGPDYEKLAKFDPCALSDSDRQRKQWRRLDWFLSFSAKLRPSGPWLDEFVPKLPDGWAWKKSRQGFYLAVNANATRTGKGSKRTQLELARLPGLRILSVDLGHRYAAACAVWETLSLDQFRAEVGQREVLRGGTENNSLFCHTRHTGDDGKQRTTIYRRIGPDELDGAPHPAPWARLDRQFLVRLQGEEQDTPVRRATAAEFRAVNQLRGLLGLMPQVPRETVAVEGVSQALPRVDELQAEAVRLARLGLRRLGDYARIAYAMTATREPIAGGKWASLTGPENRERRVQHLQNALVRWKELARPELDDDDFRSSQSHVDEWAEKQYQQWVEREFGGADESAKPVVDPTWSNRRRKDEEQRAPFRQIAERLAERNNADLYKLWAEQWNERRGLWQRQLRWLRRFILPRIGRRPAGTDAHFAEWKQRAVSLRHVGGLSLLRLNNIRELYRVLKAFHMRPEPEDLRKNVPKAGDASLGNFGRRVLSQLERLREQRVKQLASRIIEAALGIGSENRQKHWDGDRHTMRPRRRIQAPGFRPCHAVVVEDLEHYRPEESRFRRENRQLMDWAARNVRKFIVEGCELNGLHFVEVSPAYTSRQNSRTGAPGVRCVEVQKQLLEAAVAAPSRTQTAWNREQARTIFTWRRQFKQAGERAKRKDNTARDDLLIALAAKLRTEPHALPKLIRLPLRGGDLFVAGRGGAAGGVHADLNAAANIGLKSLMDPDWPASWWYIPVSATDGVTTPAEFPGSPLLGTETLKLLPINGELRKSKRDKLNAWRDVSAAPLAFSPWHGKQYWVDVEAIVTGQLAAQLGLSLANLPEIS